MWLASEIMLLAGSSYSRDHFCVKYLDASYGPRPIETQNLKFPSCNSIPSFDCSAITQRPHLIFSHFATFLPHRAMWRVPNMKICEDTWPTKLIPRGDKNTVSSSYQRTRSRPSLESSTTQKSQNIIFRVGILRIVIRLNAQRQVSKHAWMWFANVEN